MKLERIVIAVLSVIVVWLLVVIVFVRPGWSKSGGSAGAGSAGSAQAGSFEGIWLVTWSSGGPYRYELGESKAALDVDQDPKPASKLQRNGDTLLVWTQVGTELHTHRYRLAGKYLVAEAWFVTGAFDGGAPPNAIGYAERAPG